MRSSPVASLTLLSLLSAYTFASSPPVKVSLKTSWPAPSLLLELIECAALEHPDSYFAILDLLTSSDALPTTAPPVDQAIYESSLGLLKERGFIGQPGSRDTFELSVALHVASPQIQAYYQYFIDSKIAPPGSDCGSFVEWYGERVCDGETLRRLVEVEGLDATNATSTPPAYPRPRLLAFDHIYPDPASITDSPNRTAILYASLTSPNFRDLHTTLLSLADASASHRIQYVVRYIPPADLESRPTFDLAGYGVSLDLKKMDYLAMDDRRSRSSGGATTQDAVMDDRSHITDANSPVRVLDEMVAKLDLENLKTPLEKEEITSLGLRASQLVLDAPDPLKMLEYLSQNFPKYTLALARSVNASTELQEAILENQIRVGAGMNAVWLNGMPLNDPELQPLSLLAILRKERAVMSSLTATGLSLPQALNLVTHSVIFASQAQPEVTNGIFDASDRPEGVAICVWWNNIEKDSRYSTWSKQTKHYLRPVYPGQFPQVAKNLWNVVLVLDMSQTSSLRFITGPMSSILQRSFPFRWGVVPAVDNEKGTRVARLFYYLIDNYGRRKTLDFLTALLDAPPTTNIDLELARKEFDAMVAEAAPLQENAVTSFDAILAGSAEDTLIAGARAYAERLSLPFGPGSLGYAFVNGKFFEMDDDFLKNLQQEQAQQMEYFTRELRAGQITPETDISRFWFDLPTSSIRRNRHIFPAAKGMKVVSLPELFRASGFGVNFEGIPNGQRTPLTMWVLGDFDTADGLAIARDALRAMAMGTDPRFRVGFIQNPLAGTTSSPNSARIQISQVLYMLGKSSELSDTSAPHVLELLDVLESGDYGDAPVAALFQAAAFDAGEMRAYNQFRAACRLLVRELGFQPGDRAVVMNGRVIGPIEPGGFNPLDFATLATFEYQKRVKPVEDALMDVAPELATSESELYSNAVQMLSSIISSIMMPDPTAAGLFNQPPSPRQRLYREVLQGKHSSFQIGDNTSAIFNFGVVINPLSEGAQKKAAILAWLAATESVHIEVFMNPVTSAKETELPLKQFYRFNLQPRLAFDEQGAQTQAVVRFDGLPSEPVYTMGMDVPQSWLVRPHESQHDLDNIHLASLSGADAHAGVSAMFRLDYLVIEGHARESANSLPPRGLQLQLTTIGDSVPIADTQVVANLGYLQFKAKPGVFKLEIRAGRGEDVYHIESVGNEGWNSAPVSDAGVDVTLTSFQGLTIYPRFGRRQGMELSDVLSSPKDDEPEPGFIRQAWSQFVSTFVPQKPLVRKETPQADINIFTVASGHLYERFASIMILSVLRHTNSTVKFWFIENFLSPSFLEFIPHYAEEYGFQYELVTYKWPSWLRAQTEKQRTIWGYKILFLDVLFPMDLKKVIFVDADQIIRTDLQELVDLDLHGAPYGYTPMGDDNEEMEGFRFWKTGYWKDFLRGRPYHISALYVVDLVRFRQLAAGDRLRAQYQGLSADPESLSNLDQDLPNNLQFEVPIFSLDKNWLWCETWCSQDRLDQAKTIDLCQNPLTKEPKLARARKIPEWDQLDQEVARLARKLADEGKIQSGAAAAGADALAGIGVAKTEELVASTEAPPAETSAVAPEDASTPAAAQTEAAHVRDEL